MQDQVDDELNRLGYVMDFPPKSINGASLTDTQHKAYIAMAGSMSHSILDSLINSEGWNQVPDDKKTAVIKNTIQQSRKAAQAIVMLHSVGTNNDIIQQSIKNKKESSV